MSVLPSAASAQAITPGERVIVVWEGDRGENDRIPLMSRSETVGWAHLGDVLEAGPTNGEWVWIPAKQGYLRRADLLPYPTAIDVLTERLRSNPTSANYNLRGVLWKAKGELDVALGDYNEAVRLDPKSAAAFNNRGLAWYGKKEYDRAIRDYDEAFRLDPKDAAAFFNRAVAEMLAGRPRAAGFRTVIDLQGWGGDLAPYAVVLGYFAASRGGDEAAARGFLSDSAGKVAGEWPYPALRYLRGGIDGAELLKLAYDND